MNGEQTYSATYLIARTVWLEILRREQFKALLILMAIYLLFAAGARLAGNTQVEAVALMVNMGLWLSSALAALLTILVAARLVPSEIENQTLYVLLAKPVHRGELLLGKYLATFIAGVVVFAVFTLLVMLTWTAKFPLPGQDVGMFLQAVLLQVVALALLGSLTLLLSLLTPVAAAIPLAGLIYFAGTPLCNILLSALGTSALRQPVEWVLQYLPQFANLCLLQRFTDGADPLGWGDFLILMVYGLVLTLVFLALAFRLFERRRI